MKPTFLKKEIMHIDLNWVGSEMRVLKDAEKGKASITRGTHRGIDLVAFCVN